MSWKVLKIILDTESIDWEGEGRSDYLSFLPTLKILKF